MPPTIVALASRCPAVCLRTESGDEIPCGNRGTRSRLLRCPALSVDVTGVIKADGINQLAVSCTKKSDAAGIHAGNEERPVRLVVE